MSSELAIFENPQSLTQAMSFADTISKSGVIPSALIGKPADILVVLLTGRELGLSPMQSLRSIHVVQGKPVLGADLYRALAMGHRDCEYFRLVESSALKATFATKRKGSDEQQKTYTIDDARLAGLTNKDNWKRMPTEMLVARCSAILARLVYPDAFAGVYSESEEPDIVGDVQPPPPPQGKTRTEQLLNRVKKVEPRPTPQEAVVVEKQSPPAMATTFNPNVYERSLSGGIIEDDVPPPTDDDAPPTLIELAGASVAESNRLRKAYNEFTGEVATHLAGGNTLASYAEKVTRSLGGKIESQRNEGDYVISFGRNAGKKITEVDDGWLKWCLTNTNNAEAKEAAKVEIERRGK